MRVGPQHGLDRVADSRGDGHQVPPRRQQQRHVGVAQVVPGGVLDPRPTQRRGQRTVGAAVKYGVPLRRLNTSACGSGAVARRRSANSAASPPGMATVRSLRLVLSATRRPPRSSWRSMRSVTGTAPLGAQAGSCTDCGGTTGLAVRLPRGESPAPDQGDGRPADLARAGAVWPTPSGPRARRGPLYADVRS